MDPEKEIDKFPKDFCPRRAGQNVENVDDVDKKYDIKKLIGFLVYFEKNLSTGKIKISTGERGNFQNISCG